MTTPQEITKRLCCPECGNIGNLRLTAVDKTGFGIRQEIACRSCDYSDGALETSPEEALKGFLTYCQYAEHVSP
jgi:transcription elongation factor Elf1